MKTIVTSVTEEGVIEMTETEMRTEMAMEAETERQSVTGYWRCTKPKCQASEGHTPYFNITKPQHVRVRTQIQGQISVSIQFYNVSGHHGGPSLPQSGGEVDLAPGYWKMYFLGSLNSGHPRGIEARVFYQ